MHASTKPTPTTTTVSTTTSPMASPVRIALAIARTSALASALTTALLAAFAGTACADPRYYDRGTPVLQDIWVDPVAGDDGDSGATRVDAVRTLVEAWSRVPSGATLTGTGYRIRLVAGTYAQADVPNYFESRHGTFAYPVVIEAADGPGTALLPALNIFDCRYLYLEGLRVSQGGGDVLHCEQCDHFLLHEVTVRGTPREALAVQETVKVNQSQHVYIEDSDISGAWDNAIDFVAVQHGHLQGNVVHDAGDWCLYAKGGSAHLRIEGNEFHDCGNGGFTAGQGTGFEYMTSPWLHYEAYDVRFVNNVIHDTDRAGMGVNGGYDILLAHNTLYRIGAFSHVFEVVWGLRSCDGITATCAANLAAGGWGLTGSGEERIPNRNVHVYNNVFYNPAPMQSTWQHFAIYGPQVPGPSSNIPSPARTDTGLRIRGNVIWNGPPSHPLGIEDTDQGCQPSNPTCNATQLVADNAINTLEPEFVDAAGGDFQPRPGGNLWGATTYPPADFPGGDAPTTPAVPAGDLVNEVTRDFTGAPRGPASPPGAFGADCSTAVCGDGTVTTGCESCDDSNLDDGDGCDSNCTATGCGNGVVTVGEACDDGDATEGDGCDSNCTVSACGNGVAAPGEQCDDGNATSGDGCDATCTLDCPSAPSMSCRSAARARASKLRIADAADPARDGIKWKLKGATSTTLGDFGDPRTTTAFVACLYGTTGGTPSVVTAALVPSATDCAEPGCWTSGRSGHRYTSTAAGLVDLRLVAKSGGLADIALATKGAADFATALPLPQDPSVVMQLRSSEGPCWSAAFGAPAARNDAGLFKDASD